MKKEKLNKLHLNSTTITKLSFTKTTVIKAGVVTNNGSGGIVSCTCFVGWSICGWGC